jgi:hypothetical protein
MGSSRVWPWEGAPRVLIEDAGEGVDLATATALRRAGYAVAVCPGPASGDPCPLVKHGECSWAAGADVVVSRLGLGVRPTREIVDALRRRYASKPLVVEASDHDALVWGELLEGCRVLEAPATPDTVVDAVRAVAA